MFGWLFGRGNTPRREQAHEWVNGGALLLDVRTPSEFAGRHVEGAVNIPVQELSQRVDELDAGRRIVVYCKSGIRSRMARSVLERAGFEVCDLGAMRHW